MGIQSGAVRSGKAFWLAGLVMIGMVLNVAAGESRVSPAGLWQTIDDKTGKAKSQVMISESGGQLTGTIVALIDPPEPQPLCSECSGERHNQPVIGMTIMQSLVADGDGWSGGTILDPENGKTYRVSLELQEAGATLKVRGYIGISLLGRTQYWQRIR